MPLGLQYSQTLRWLQAVPSAQGTTWRGRLALQTPLCRFAKPNCTPGTVPYSAAHQGRATAYQRHRHQLCTRQHSFRGIRRRRQQELRLEAITQDSVVPEPSSSDQQDISENRDEAASTSYQRSSVFGELVGSLSLFYKNHLKYALEDALELPFKLHYPSRYETGWKSATVLLAILVLMGVVSTLDNAFAAAIVWYSRQALWLSSKFAVGTVLAALYCVALSMLTVNCVQTVGVHSSYSCTPQDSGS